MLGRGTHPATDLQDTMPVDVMECSPPVESNVVTSPGLPSEELRSNFQRCRGKTPPEKAYRSQEATAALPAPNKDSGTSAKTKKKTQDKEEAWDKLGICAYAHV